ncbi:MAG TPA: DUF3014 domain-containing protein [Usitatibacter sp.]|nr:DUF3014 domain-containing protein [Usitatibacter sp.]
MRETSPVKVFAIAGAIILAGAAVYYLWPGSTPPPPPPSSTSTAPAPVVQHYAVATPASAEALPLLAESDAAVTDALKKLLGPDAVGKLLVPDSLIRNIVATVDNLPRDHLAMRVSPVNAPGGTFRTTGHDDSLAVAADNGARYAPYVTAFEATDPAAAIPMYLRFYPLFQQAYIDLGFPNGYFNDRLVEVIDHLLDAPEPKGAVKLVSPHVLYEFADPDLEARSAGQKLMMRLGPDNEARVKAKLRAYRKELVSQTPASAISVPRTK